MGAAPMQTSPQSFGALEVPEKLHAYINLTLQLCSCLLCQVLEDRKGRNKVQERVAGGEREKDRKGSEREDKCQGKGQSSPKLGQVGKALGL